MNSVFSKRPLKCAASCAAVLAGVLIGASGLAATASAQTPVKLVLNWKYQGPQALFFVAEDKGYFKAEGLDVTIDQGEGSEQLGQSVNGPPGPEGRCVPWARSS